jgi:hypothetical protein
MQLRIQRPLHVQGDAGHPFNRVLDKKSIIRKKWRAGEEERHKGLLPPPPKKDKKTAKTSLFSAVAADNC